MVGGGGVNLEFLGRLFSININELTERRKGTGRENTGGRGVRKENQKEIERELKKETKEIRDVMIFFLFC